MSISLVRRTLDHFGNCSGLHMNNLKSQIYIGGVAEEQKSNLIRISGMQEGELPVRYLGIPLHQRQLQVNEYKPLVHKIQSKLCSWSVMKMSYAGRMTLISSVLESIFRFWSAIFHFPMGLITQLNSLCGKFLWSGKEGGGNKARIAWNMVCQPRSHGGLGFKELLAWNRTNMFQWVRDIAANEGHSIWHNWLQAYRLKGQNVLGC